MKWSAFVDGGDGCFYGIPFNARRVVKFNPLDKSLTEIGTDLGDSHDKWRCGGVRANTGSIYCAPYHAERKHSQKRYNRWHGGNTRQRTTARDR